MNRVCTVCERFSADGNLWCERLNCPLEELRPIFGYGEQFGEFKILRLVRLLRSAALYEAQQQNRAVLLKVGYQGEDEFIRREGAIASKMAGRDDGFLQPSAAYSASNLTSHPYGKAVFDHNTYYYVVYGHVHGEFLADMLLKNPMPWYRDAAWIVIQVARLLHEMHRHSNVIHAGALQGSLLIRWDHNNIPRPTLVDFGWMLPVGSTQNVATDSVEGVPPELKMESFNATPATDVYGLARLLTVMLSGRNRSDSASPQGEADASLADTLGRADLPQSAQVGANLRKALANDPHQRPQTVAEFAAQLVTIFGKPPLFAKPNILNGLARKADWGTVAFGGMIAFLMLIIVILAVSR